MPSVLIGCPVKDRGWIIETWWEYLIQAIGELDFQLDYKFILACSKEDTTVDAISDLVQWGDVIVHYVEEESGIYKREWSASAYGRMVAVRNDLLGAVRAYGPDCFVSIDSDILAHPSSLKNMFETLGKKKSSGCVAVGGKTYLEEVGRRSPNYGCWTNYAQKQNFKRSDSERVMKVDALMAFKLMTPAAYNVDYSYHVHGEDLGWSKNVRKAGGTLWWDGRETSKHVMTKDWLEIVDVRCGY
jgi:hypothetical protein